MLKIISQLNAGTQETLTADAIWKFLREKQMSLLVKNGGMCPVPLQGMQEHRMLVFAAAILRNPRGNEPPMLSLELESHQGYPQVIGIEAFRNPRGAGVTVQDVLWAIHEDLKISFFKWGLSKLGVGEPAWTNTSFGAICKSEEESTRGPRRIGCLGIRERLKILSRLSPDDRVLLPT